jgi:DNA polymerase-3 subunit gamma/tau
MYQVLARKWRPRTFDELVGQRHVSETLSNAIRADRLAHAYLFAGLRGTGKTTVARILAKCLNCVKGPTTEPCGTCDACTEIADSRSLDVLEIDAASRTKVEQTRELLEVVSYAPARDRNKILIIDEAHMLSKPSFNALLKTLEEPPPNVVFVLATTEIQKILPTILSRCQVFEFRRVPPAELIAHLRHIVDEEKLRISDATLERVARAGEGSVRDALSVLERLVAFCGEEVPDDAALHVLGTVRSGVLVELVAGLAARDAGRMLGVLDGLIDEGHDLVRFWDQAIGAIRDLLVMRSLPDRPDVLSRPPEEAAGLAAAAAPLSRDDLTRAFQLLADLEQPLKTSAQPRYLFEAALIRLAAMGAVLPIEELLAGLESGRSERAPAAPARPTPRATPPRESRPPAPGPVQKKKEDAPAGDFATRLIAALRGSRPLLAAILEQAPGIALAEDAVRIRLRADMDALRRQLELRDGLEAVRREATAVAGRPVRIELETLAAEPDPEAGDDDAAAEPGETEPPPRQEERRASPPARTGPGGGDTLVQEARRDPGVRKLLDTFSAQVLEVRKLDLSAEPADEAGNGSTEDA